MSEFQEANEVNYKASLRLLEILLRRGLISQPEYEEIDQLNQKTFFPQLAKVYA